MTGPRKLVFAALAAFAFALALTACGGASDEDLEKAREQGAQEQREKDAQKEQEEKQEELEKKIEKLEKEAKERDDDSSGGSDGGGGGGSSTRGGASRYCSEGLGVGPNTTCAFAENVRSEWASAGGGTVTVDVYSPVTGATYRMRCTDGPTTVCRGGNNAVVYIY